MPTLPTETDVSARTLYLYYNREVAGAGDAPLDGEDIAARALYVYYNREPALTWDSRTLYVYYNRCACMLGEYVAARTLYTYGAWTEDEIFPWIERIVPNEQYPGGQVAIYGDGFGDDADAETSAVRFGDVDATVAGPGDLMGIVTWSTRSAGLYPANSGVRSSPAIVVTVPVDAEDGGQVSVEETT